MFNKKKYAFLACVIPMLTFVYIHIGLFFAHADRIKVQAYKIAVDGGIDHAVYVVNMVGYYACILLAAIILFVLARKRMATIVSWIMILIVNFHFVDKIARPSVYLPKISASIQNPIAHRGMSLILSEDTATRLSLIPWGVGILVSVVFMVVYFVKSKEEVS